MPLVFSWCIIMYSVSAASCRVRVHAQERRNQQRGDGDQARKWVAWVLVSKGLNLDSLSSPLAMCECFQDWWEILIAYLFFPPLQGNTVSV